MRSSVARAEFQQAERKERAAPPEKPITHLRSEPVQLRVGPGPTDYEEFIEDIPPSFPSEVFADSKVDFDPDEWWDDFIDDYYDQDDLSSEEATST